VGIENSIDNHTEVLYWECQWCGQKWPMTQPYCDCGGRDADINSDPVYHGPDPWAWMKRFFRG